MQRACFLSIVLVGTTLACHKPVKDEPSVDGGAVTTSSATPLAASIDAGPPAPQCDALGDVAPFATCTTKVVKSPPPDIEDKTNSLAPFWEKLAAMERKRGTKMLRIGMYGDSNLTSDFISGHLRRVLQARYGDAGHGWISLSRPWGSYRHENVSTGGMWNLFKQWAPTTHVCPDKEYGFANMAAETSEIGAAGWAGTTKDEKSPVGKAVTRFEFHYLKMKNGGSIRIEIDKKEVKQISTKADAFELGVETFEVDEGPHELRAFARGDGKVRWFGTSLDRIPTPFDPAQPGVQFDSLGAGALNYERLTWVADDVRKPGLQKRDYDLVIIWLGMNVMFVPPNEGFAKSFLADLKDALPNTPVLLLGPSDTVREGEEHSDPRIVQVVNQMRKVAQDSGVAFWDFREAMGGDASVVGFTKRGLTGEDHIHFGPEGGQLMGDRLLCSTTNAFAGYLKEHPTAGCTPPPVP